MNFIPEIWTLPRGEARLVCGRRWLRSEPVKGAAHSTAYSTLVLPVAVVIRPVFGVEFNVSGPDGTVWTRHRLGAAGAEEFGVSRRCGELALAEAWRCVALKYDVVDTSAHGRHDLKKLAGFRDGAILRNIWIWSVWDRWDREKLSLRQRVAEIERNGFSMTEKALRRLLEDAGIPIP